MRKLVACFALAVAFVAFACAPGGDGCMRAPSCAEAVSQSEVNLLARLINAETSGQSYEVALAVGAVVVNRLGNDNFPNTLAGVIFQSGAFVSVADGRINGKPSEDALKAATEVFAGVDPTEGCLYYCNPRTETSKFYDEREAKNAFGIYRFYV